eukprot:26108_1
MLRFCTSPALRRANPSPLFRRSCVSGVFAPKAHFSATATVTPESKLWPLTISHPQMCKIIDYSSKSMLFAIPAGLLVPSLDPLTNIVLAVVIPAHVHIGLAGVVTDYVPTMLQKPSKIVLIGATAFTFLGLFHMILTGDGIIGNVRKLWKKPADKTG